MEDEKMEDEKQYSERLAQGPAEVIQSYYTAPLLRGAKKEGDR